MTENTSSQEVLQITVNGNSGLFVKGNLENYLSGIEDALKSAEGPNYLLKLYGFSDSHTTKKATIFFKVSDCIKVAQFH